MGENSNQQRSVLEELIKFTEAIQMENTSKLLLFNAPKLYKVAESTFESLPQLLLQLYVLITTSRNISTSNYFLLISSVTLSFISHAYAGTKLLYPNGYAQAIVGFLFTVSDTALRSLGLLYVFVTVDFGQKRLLICFLYIGSSCLFFLLLIAKFGTVPSEMQRGEYSFFISCLYTFIFFFSASTGFFVMTNAFNTAPEGNTKAILKYELFYRYIAIACVILACGYENAMGIFVSIVILATVTAAMYFATYQIFNLDTLPRNKYGNLLLESSWILRSSIGFLVLLGVPIYYMVTFYELQVVQFGGSNTYGEESSSMSLFIIGGIFLHIILGCACLQVFCVMIGSECESGCFLNGLLTFGFIVILIILMITQLSMGVDDSPYGDIYIVLVCILPLYLILLCQTFLALQFND